MRSDLALLGAVAVVLTWPLAARIGVAVPGMPTSDTYDHLWGYWWYAHALAHGELPIRTTVSHWPPGGPLWFVDPAGAIVSLPFQALVGSAGGGYAITVLFKVWGGLAAGYLAAWQLTRERAPALLGAVVFGGSAYVLSLLYSGTTEFLELAPLPLAWMAIRRALAKGGRGPVLLAAAAWTWATLGNFYHAAFVGLLLGIAVLSERAGGRAMLGRALAVVAAWAVFAAPIVAIAAWSLLGEGGAVTSGSAPGWNYQVLPAVDLLSFVHPGDYYFPDNAAFGNDGIQNTGYLGLLALLVALVGAWRDRALRLPLALTGLVALGPTLAFHQQLVLVDGHTVPLPAALLYFPGSPFRLVHHPFRLVVLPMLFMGLAAARATSGRPRLALALAAGVLAETLWVSPGTFPIPTADATAPALTTALRDDPAVHGVFDFPPDHRALNRRYEALATVHGKRIPYGVNVYLPDALRGNGFVRAMMGCLKRPARTSIPREGGPPVEPWRISPSEADVATGRAALLAAELDVVVLHLTNLAPKEASCARTLLGGEAMYGDTEAEAWRVAR